MPSSISDEAALRALIGEPSDLVRAKVSDRPNTVTRRFIDLSLDPGFDGDTNDAECAARYSRREGLS